MKKKICFRQIQLTHSESLIARSQRGRRRKGKEAKEAWSHYMKCPEEEKPQKQKVVAMGLEWEWSATDSRYGDFFGMGVMKLF